MQHFIIPALLFAALSNAQVEFNDPIVLESPNTQENGYFGGDRIAAVPDVNGDGSGRFRGCRGVRGAGWQPRVGRSRLPV